ncbi:MAG: thylakoid membrane photosystem I accumulation factor [Cyanobacteriota bacterium]|nr:thylakoid membrane photosystem I accumulation factor [Cyanobacteriota bacterium]
MPRAAAALLRPLLVLVLTLGLSLGLQLAVAPVVEAALTTNSYDGNIYALYAGNGSLVPPRSSLAQALAAHRPVVVVYYLDDDAASKRFAPVVSELQRLWGNQIELIPLTTDLLQNRPDRGPTDPAHYWKGQLPQVVVFNAEGRVLFDQSGPVPLAGINQALSEATGMALPADLAGGDLRSFNELNAEVVNR